MLSITVDIAQQYVVVENISGVSGKMAQGVNYRL